MGVGMTSRVLHESGRYVACLTRAGLSVQLKSNQRGIILKAYHPQYADYLAAFDDVSATSHERDLMCRSLLS